MFFVKILGSRDSDHEVTKLKACLESPDKKHWAKTASSFLGCRFFDTQFHLFLHTVVILSALILSWDIVSIAKRKTIGNLLLWKDMFKILIIHTFIIVEELGLSNKTFAYSCLAADSVGRKTSQTSHKTQTNIPTILYDRQTMHLKYSQSDIYTFMREISVRNLEIFLVRRCVFCIK